MSSFTECRVPSSLERYLLPTDSSSVTIETLCLRKIQMDLKEHHLSLNYIPKLIGTHTPVHAEVKSEMQSRLKDVTPYVTVLLAQDYVNDNALLKMAKSLCKKENGHVVGALFAVDGLAGFKHAPTYDLKRYVQNLRYSLSGETNEYDDGDALKRTHVNSVRAVYNALKSIRGEGRRLEQDVFQVMVYLLSQHANLVVADQKTDLSPNDLEQCATTYLKEMGKENFAAWSEQLKAKLERRTNKRKREESEDE